MLFGLYSVWTKMLVLNQEQFGNSGWFIIPYKFIEQFSHFYEDYSWGHNRYYPEYLVLSSDSWNSDAFPIYLYIY